MNKPLSNGSRVWLTGDAVVDLIPEGDHYLKCPGGAPANVAVGVARLGINTGFFGRVGNDPFGRFMRQTLSDEGVDVTFMRLDDNHRTSTVIVDLDNKGERSFTFMVKPSADQFLDPADVPEFHQGDWLHACSIALANEPSRSTTLNAMKMIKAQGGFVSFDPNLREEVWTHPEELNNVVLTALKLSDVVKFSDDELCLLMSCNDIDLAIEQLLSHYSVPLAIITQGKKGALVIHKGEIKQISGRPVEPVDTTGAGDAFVGGLLAGLAAQANWQDQNNLTTIIQQANACGALATTAKGAMTALPTKEGLILFQAASTT